VRLPLLTLSVLLGIAATMPRLEAQSNADRSARNTRTEIQSRIAEAEKIVSSPGYSGRLKQIKRQELALLRKRLEDGDLQPGDQVSLAVEGESSLNGMFAVNSARAITFPGLADISVRGVLRSELQDHMTRELERYFRKPVVHVQSTVRLAILGSVGKPGFYQIESEKMIGEVIMTAGGPGGGADPAKTHVERDRVVILDREAFSDALARGLTLDQMNLRAGDEIVVGARSPKGNLLGTALPILTAVASLGFFLTQIIRW
jgi:protein involved in polysaccharide export with SLBB domain